MFPPMRARTVLVMLAIAATMCGAACDEKLSDLTGPTPNLEPTFSSIHTSPQRGTVSGSANSASTGACSAARPPYMTSTSWATRATTPRSWVIQMSEVPLSRQSRWTSARIWPWIARSG